MSRELALMLEDGTIIRDSGWKCIADVHRSQHGFFHNGEQVSGKIVDAVTLVQVYPIPQVPNVIDRRQPYSGDKPHARLAVGNAPGDIPLGGREKGKT